MAGLSPRLLPGHSRVTPPVTGFRDVENSLCGSLRIAGSNANCVRVVEPYESEGFNSFGAALESFQYVVPRGSGFGIPGDGRVPGSSCD